MRRIAVLAAAAVLTLSGTASAATRPVTVSAADDCTQADWTVPTVVTSKTARVVDIYSDSDYGYVLEAAEVHLTAGKAKTVTLHPGPYAQRYDILVQPTGKPDADALAQTYVFPPWVGGC